MEGIAGLDFIGSGGKAIASLCFVLALIVCVLIAMKKMAFHRQRGSKDLMIRRISSMPLSARERIDVVEVSGQRLVLGVAQAGISLLVRIQAGADEKRDPDAQES
jgi:flagellar biosynthetic protein FliO